MFYSDIEYEKPIDLLLDYIKKMEDEGKSLDRDIDHMHKSLLNKLNSKVDLEMKIEKWKRVAETFRFKKK